MQFIVYVVFYLKTGLVGNCVLISIPRNRLYGSYCTQLTCSNIHIISMQNEILLIVYYQFQQLFLVFQENVIQQEIFALFFSTYHKIQKLGRNILSLRVKG